MARESIAIPSRDLCVQADESDTCSDGPSLDSGESGDFPCARLASSCTPVALCYAHPNIRVCASVVTVVGYDSGLTR